MKPVKFNVLFQILLLVVFTFCLLGCLRSKSREDLSIYYKVQVIELKGSGYERGLKYGIQLKIEIAEVIERVAGRVAVFGNMDAVRFGLHAAPEEVAAEVERQAGIGAQAKGFVVSTGSPFPLDTNPRVIDTLIAAAHSFTTQAPGHEGN